MAKKWRTIAITEDDWRLLKAISQILVKPQARVLGDYLWSLAPCLSIYEKASLVFDNSKLKLSLS